MSLTIKRKYRSCQISDKKVCQVQIYHHHQLVVVHSWTQPSPNVRHIVSLACCIQFSPAALIRSSLRQNGGHFTLTTLLKGMQSESKIISELLTNQVKKLKTKTSPLLPAFFKRALSYLIILPRYVPTKLKLKSIHNVVP